MKTLVIGDANSIWIKCYIENILIPLKHEVTICDINAKPSQFLSFYSENNIISIKSENNFWTKIPKLGVLFKKKQIINKIKKCGTSFENIVNIYVSPFSLKIISIVKRRDTNIYLWFIGSDLFRSSNKQINKLKTKIMLLNPYILCSSGKLANAYDNLIGVFKPLILDFGYTQIPLIDNYRTKSYQYCKKEFLGIENDIKTITVGYNGSIAQQHLSIIESIKELVANNNDIYVIVPMTYGGNSEYKNKVLKMLNENNIRNVVLTKYLTPNEMALLWLSTDIFIHAQTTDAFSSSMVEAIYANCSVINADWLKYPEFDRLNIFVQNFKSFEELKEILKIEIKKERKNIADRNNALFDYASWESCLSKWKEMFNNEK